MEQKASPFAKAQGQFNFYVEDGSSEIITLGYDQAVEPSFENNTLDVGNHESTYDEIIPLAKAQAEFDFNTDVVKEDEEIKTIGYDEPSKDWIKYADISNKNGDITHLVILPRNRGYSEYFVLQVKREYKSGGVYQEPDHYWPTLTAANHDFKDWQKLAEKCDW